MSGRWVDLREAAELLGTSTEAVGKRAWGNPSACGGCERVPQLQVGAGARPLRTPLSASRGGADFSGRGGDGLGGARSLLVRLED
jgi:hypothetical protein